MKTLLKICFIAFLSVVLIQPVQGQKLLNKLKQRVEKKLDEKAKEKAEEKIDEKIDEELDKASQNEKEEPADENDNSGEEKMQQKMQGLLKGLGLNSEPVPIEDSYQFDHLIQMHIESFDSGGSKTSEGEFITHFNPKTKSMAYQVVSGDMAQKGQGMFIIDVENQATLILGEEKGEKTGIVYGMNSFFESMGEAYEEDDFDFDESPDTYLANPNVSKTGKTKNIAGYKCEEYVYKDENGTAHYWITKDLKISSQDYFSTIFKTSSYSSGMGWGYMMEATSIDNESGEKSMMSVTKVDTNSNVQFSIGDYQITNLGSFQMPVEE
ncbi:MAG: DUF4412 domain-containing protein [Prolixibacteraceae bacterium]|jgi:hypothetical protein|nr:DUF4412 domain-containing protein [Prolixibacteraceae bacterium]MBT7000236.1 DUF4412 domain-containing protein [Prolixibacteraceae bacterium]MBT7394217.1 DUF4412 domain-containing protein [Prolixibacteraceae bacterium]